MGHTGPGQQESLPNNSWEGRLLCQLWEQGFGPQGGRKGDFCAACYEKGEGDKGWGLFVPQQITRAGQAPGQGGLEFFSLSKGICLAGGFSVLSTEPFPFSQRASLPLKPISIPLTLSPSPPVLPMGAEGELAVGRRHQAGRAQGRVCARERLGEEETRAVFQAHTADSRTKHSWISAAPAPNPPPRPFSQPKGQWTLDINNPIGSAHGYPARPHCCLASPSAQLRPARHSV